MPGYAPGSYQTFITVFTKIFYSSKSVYIIHEGYSQKTEQIRFCFPSTEGNLFNLVFFI